MIFSFVYGFLRRPIYIYNEYFPNVSIKHIHAHTHTHTRAHILIQTPFLTHLNPSNEWDDLTSLHAKDMHVGIRKTKNRDFSNRWSNSQLFTAIEQKPQKARQHVQMIDFWKSKITRVDSLSLYTRRRNQSN